jgi:hypothetical protein
LHILKLDDDKNKKGADYSDYTDYLKYILNVSYFETYCTGKEKIDDSDQGSFLLKDLANKTTENKIKGCKLGKYGSFNNIKLSGDAYQNFLRYTFTLIKMRGWTNLSQGKYSQAKVDLESAWFLADEVSILLHNYINTLKRKFIEEDLYTEEDFAKRANILGNKSFLNKILDNKSVLDKILNDEKIFKDVLIDAQETLSDWERRKAESACLLVQSLKGLKITNKSKKNQSLYKKQCYGYKPDNFYTWRHWTPEYSRWSQPE